MGRRGWTIIGVLAAIALVVAYLGSPLLAMERLKSAARSHDAERLEKVVDFPAVRESLKSQMNALMVRTFQSDPRMRDNPFAGVAMMFAPVMVERVVDGLVTADGIAAMLDTGSTKTEAPAQASPAEPSGAPPPAKPQKATLSYAYKDLDTFRVTSTSRTDPKAKVDFIFRRTGLFGWRLTRIGLPIEAMAPAGTSPG